MDDDDSLTEDDEEEWGGGGVAAVNIDGITACVQRTTVVNRAKSAETARIPFQPKA